MIALVAIVVLFALAKGGGSLVGGGADVQAKQGALSTAQAPDPSSLAPPAGQSTAPAGTLKDRIHKLEDTVLPIGAGVVGAAACSYFGAGAAAPACAKVGSLLEKPARKLANWSTAKATDIGGTLLNKQAAVINAVTAGVGAKVASTLAGGADKLYNLAGNAPGPLKVVTKAAVLPLKVTADLGAKGAGLVQKGGGALVSGVKAGTSAVSSGVHTVLSWL